MAAIKDRLLRGSIKEVDRYLAVVHRTLVLDHLDSRLHLLAVHHNNPLKLWEVAKETIIRLNQVSATFNTLSKIASPI